jgi:hypothetical protein
MLTYTTRGGALMPQIQEMAKMAIKGQDRVRTDASVNTLYIEVGPEDYGQEQAVYDRYSRQFDSKYPPHR